jgi:hypothetical protein
MLSKVRRFAKVVLKPKPILNPVEKENKRIVDKCEKDLRYLIKKNQRWFNR